MVPDPQGKPVPRAVQVGLETGDQAEIVSGVADGEKVLVTRKRYTPQAQAASSPLVMTGPRQGQSQSSGRRNNR